MKQIVKIGIVPLYDRAAHAVTVETGSLLYRWNIAGVLHCLRV